MVGYRIGKCGDLVRGQNAHRPRVLRRESNSGTRIAGDSAVRYGRLHDPGQHKNVTANRAFDSLPSASSSASILFTSAMVMVANFQSPKRGTR